jgi:hypothetical protein
MNKIPQLAEVIQRVLGDEAEQAGRESGFIKRARVLSGATFVQSMVFGWLANGDASLSELQQAAANAGVQITPQGLDSRFTPEAAECLYRVLQRVVRVVVEHPVEMVPVLERFNGVYITDSSVVGLPAALRELWSGCGGSAGHTAAVKLQTRLNYSTGQVCDILLRPGREHDTRAVAELSQLPGGSLRLEDLGYFKLDSLQADTEAGRYWLTRLKTNTVVYTAEGQPIEVVTLLSQADTTTLDIPVKLGQQHQLGCRLLARRVSPEQAARTRRKLKRAAQKRGQTLSPKRLMLADWVLYVTNAPVALLSTAEAFVLARVRWQIELLFKLWKSAGRLAHSRSAHPWRVLCEVYAKLIALLLQHWIMVSCCWANPLRSLTKAAQTIRKHAFHLACSLPDLGQLWAALTAIERCLAAGCRLDTRRTQPSTAHLLLALA